MAKQQTPKRPRSKSFMLTQQLNPENFTWTANFDETTVINMFSTPQASADSVAVMVVAQLDSYLNSIGNTNDITNVFYILHDKDKHPDGTPKEPHIHMIVTFAKQVDRSVFAYHAGVAEQYVESPKKGRYGLLNMLSYLIHAKDSEKHQYQPDEVHDMMTLPAGVTGAPTVTNEKGSYLDVYRRHSLEWAKGKASKTRHKSMGEDIDWLESEILSGKLTRKQILLTDDLYRIASVNWSRVTNALAVYSARKAELALDDFEKGKYQLTTLFITGEPGSGKTYLAKKIINELQTRHSSWQVYQGAGSNPVDDYQGEEIMFLDDLRGNSMLASDWLKVMDPINNSRLSARYANVQPVQRVLIITSFQDATTFFSYAKSAGDEALSQFIRRISNQVKVLQTPTLQDLDSLGYKVNDLDRPITKTVPYNGHYIAESLVNAMKQIGPIARISAPRELAEPKTITVTNGNRSFLKSTKYDFYHTGTLKTDDAVTAVCDVIDDRNEDLNETIEARDIHNELIFTDDAGSDEQE